MGVVAGVYSPFVQHIMAPAAAGCSGAERSGTLPLWCIRRDKEPTQYPSAEDPYPLWEG